MDKRNCPFGGFTTEAQRTQRVYISFPIPGDAGIKKTLSFLRVLRASVVKFTNIASVVKPINLLEKHTMDINDLTGRIIGAAIEVHKTLGPGLLESAYEECLSREFDLRKMRHKRQQELPIEYKGIKLDCGYRLDIVVEDQVIIELKSCDSLQPIHEAQLLTYLKLSGLKIGLLINFNVPVLRDGIKRIAN